MITTVDLSTVKQNIASKFELISQQNPDLKLELSAEGKLIIMSPTGGTTGKYNARLIVYFGIWNETNKLGELFDSSTCFKLPNGGLRSPDVSWIIKERWESLTIDEQDKFPPIAPDFVLELMSKTDSLTETQAKMAEYLTAGVRLGWLLNPQTKEVEIYRYRQEKEVLINPQNLSGEDVLPGLLLDLSKIW
jgi:Uma2 family endonuclease